MGGFDHLQPPLNQPHYVRFSNRPFGVKRFQTIHPLRKAAVGLNCATYWPNVEHVLIQYGKSPNSISGHASFWREVDIDQAQAV